MTPDDLRPEYTHPEAGPLFVAVCEFMLARLRYLNTLRKDHPSLTYQDTVIATYIYSYAVNNITTGRGGRGAKTQWLIDHLPISRSTVRDGLRRLDRAELICRHEDGLWYPTKQHARYANEAYHDHLEALARVAKTYDSFENVNGRPSPMRILRAGRQSAT